MPDSHAYDTPAQDDAPGVPVESSASPLPGVRAGSPDRRAARMAKRRGMAPPAPAGTEHHEAAMAAHSRADYVGAMALWAELRAAAPDNPAGFVWGILSAKAAGREDVAHQLAEEGATRLPRLAASLRSAAAAAAWEAADEAWHNAIGKGRRNRTADLEAALAPLKKTPLSKTLRQELVLGRLRVLQQKYANSRRVQGAVVSMLFDMGQLEAAAELAEACVEKFPKSEAIVLQHVAVLDKLERYQEAYTAIAALRDGVAADPAIEVAYSQALSRLGELDAAEAACAPALAAFPDNLELASEYATLATRRGAWAEAISRWEAAEAKWPNKADIQRSLKALRLLVVDAEPERSMVPRSEEGASETSSMFARFESLGGSTMGCEFGIVQRHFGSTALGLLRWSTIKTDGLCKGLHHGFAGLGELDNVVITTYRNAAGREEYVVSDCTYGYASHTYISTKDAPADKMKVQTARRLTFMTEKLMEELQSASRICVYKFGTDVDDEAVRTLYAALQTKGAVTLLCVMRARDDNEPGSVRQLQDNVFVGYVRSFLNVGPEDIDYENWKACCTEVLVRYDAARALT